MAHHKAIGTIDSNGVMSQAAFADINAGIGRLIASVPESTTMGIYDTFKPLIGSDVPEYLMSTVKAEDARIAYAGLLNFKDVVKANPITAVAPPEPKIPAEKLNAISEAAGKLSAASYPFIKSVDWTSDLYTRPLPGVTSKAALEAIDKAIVMGASMDGKLLKEAAEAHHKAIASVDAKGVTSAADYEAVNAALGKVIASVPKSQVMDVYNAFAKITDPNIPNKLYSMIGSPLEPIAAYKALMEFKEVVKAAQA